MPLPKLQALVYNILPWRKVPESDARSVALGVFYWSVAFTGLGSSASVAVNNLPMFSETSES